MTVYNPHPTNISQPGNLAIVSSTNASPIVLNIPAHGINDGDVVHVRNHSGNTAANGTWRANFVDPNNIALYFLPSNGGGASTGNGVGGATGRVQPISFGAFTTYGDSPAPSATILMGPNNYDADLGGRSLIDVGNYKDIFIFESGQASLTPSSGTLWASWTFAADDTWTDDTGGFAVWTPGGVFLDPNPGQAPDVLEIEFEGSAELTSTPAGYGSASFALWVRFAPPGASLGVFFKVPFSDRIISTPTTGAVVSLGLMPIHLKGVFFNPLSVQVSQIQISIRAATPNHANIADASMGGAYRIACRQKRPTQVVAQ